MLLAIDIGNTHTVFGIWDGSEWVHIWRRVTNADATEDEVAAWFHSLVQSRPLVRPIQKIICASVVPAANASITLFAQRWLKLPIPFLKSGDSVGLPVTYQPPSAVGADRIANALGALARWKPPIVVVDFGTATTFDVIDELGQYAGGAILPGVILSSQALFSRAAKLPTVEFVAPAHAIGRTTSESLQAGIMLGYAGAVDRLAERISAELPVLPKIVATGGLGGLFLGLSERLESYESTLTLDGLVVASGLLSSGR